eukprot:9183699-Lingulodinium_polyedra.AAC.1
MFYHNRGARIHARTLRQPRHAAQSCLAGIRLRSKMFALYGRAPRPPHSPPCCGGHGRGSSRLDGLL